MLSSGKWPVDATATFTLPSLPLLSNMFPPFLSDIREIKIHVYGNSYHMTKFSLFYYFYSKISSLTPVSSIRNVLDSFCLLISTLRNSQLKCDVHCLFVRFKSCVMEGVFCIPFVVGTEADLRLPGRPGSRLLKCIVGRFWGKHFQLGGKFVPKNSPTMHFHNHVRRSPGRDGCESALWDGFGGRIFNMTANSSPKTVPQCTFTTMLWVGNRVEMVVKVHCETVLEDAFSTWRQIRPPKQTHNALWQPSRPGPPRNLKVANRGRNKEKNSHGYDRRDWVQVGNQYSNLGNTCCKHQGSSGFPRLGAITEYVQKRNQIISSYGL